MKKKYILILTIVAVLVVIFVLFKNNKTKPSGDDANIAQNPISEYVFKTKYITPVDWPATYRTVEENFSCLNAGNETDRAGQTQKQNIGGVDYCITKVSEGAAGSMYTNYAISRAVGSNTEIATFSLRFPQCYNYDNPKQSDCLKEQREFDLTQVIKSIFR